MLIIGEARRVLENFPSTFEPHPPRPGKVPIRVGDRVKVINPRVVEKVGYRKSWKDYYILAENLLHNIPCPDSLKSIWTQRNHIKGLAKAMADRDSLGGPERGVHLRDIPPPDRVLIVHGKRNARIGTYYPPSGHGEDYDDGGLRNAYTIVILSTSHGEFLSTDLERVDSNKAPK